MIATPNTSLAIHRDVYRISLVGIFFVSRALAWGNGVGMDLTADYQWQLLDPRLLTDQLGESLWYLHAQPPAFNALHGVVLNTFSGNAAQTLAWQSIQFGLGIVLLISLYSTMRVLQVSQVTSMVLTALFICSPAAIAYENFLSYTYLDATLLSVAAWGLVSATMRKQLVGLWAFFAALTLLCFTRSAFHLVWLLVIIALVVGWAKWMRHDFFSAIVAAALISAGLVGSLYIKNHLVFGFAGPSSWMGMNLATMTHTNLDESARRGPYQAEHLSPLVAADPFRALRDYPPALTDKIETGIAALDQKTRFDGSPNFNHGAYIPISRQFGKDAFVLLQEHPEHYVKAVLRNAATYLFRSASDYRLIDPNMNRMRRWEAIHAVVAYGQFGGISRAFSSASPQADGEILKHLTLGEVIQRKAAEACWLLGVMVVGLTIYSMWQTLRRPRRLEWPLFAFAACTLVYVMAVTLLANFGEAQRMRFEVEPLFVILLGLFLRDAQAWRKRTGGRATAAHLPQQV